MSLSRGSSSGGSPAVMSISPASYACTAVVPSEIIRPLIRFSFTVSALRQSFHFARSSREL